MIQSNGQAVISLIIPAYNIGKYLDDCLYSLYRKTYQNCEAVVVDDGSTDETPEICDEWSYKDERVKVIHQKNSGVSIARNTALKNISGDIVGFVDGDDLLTDNALEVVAKCFSDDTLDAVFTGHKRIDENRNETETRKGVKRNNCTGEEAVYSTLKTGRDGYLGVPWNKFFRKKCIYKSLGEIIEFDSKYKVGEDQIWLLHVLEKVENVKFIEEPIYCYRIRTGSAVHSKAWNVSNESEIEARTELVRIVSTKYPNLKFAASEKCRRCMKKLYKFAVSIKNTKAIGMVSRCGLKGYFDVMKSEKFSMQCKLKETLWQMVFIVSSLIFH